MDQAMRDQIISIIDDMQDMTIATVREDGFPQATTVSYVNEGLAIYFGSSVDSQKAKNIVRSNKVSLTINRHYETWDAIEGLSMGAIASPITDPQEFKRVGALMIEKFPQISNYASEFEEEPAMFRLDPTVISVLDYSKGFGYTALVEI